jgi:hypothetical protein
MRVGLLHLGQSVDFVVSISFLRSPVFAIFAIVRWFSFSGVVSAHTRLENARLQRRGVGQASGCKWIASEDERNSLHSV